MKTFNKDKPYTSVGGRAPLAIMQDGGGFDGSGRYLGDVNPQGELVATSAKPAGGEGGGTPPTQAEIYGAMKVPEIQALLTERGIEPEKGTKKAGLIDLLLADDAAKEAKAAEEAEAAAKAAQDAKQEPPVND